MISDLIESDLISMISDRIGSDTDDDEISDQIGSDINDIRSD